MADRERRVTVRSREGYQNHIVNGQGYATAADEPPSAGGQGAGLGPFEMLAAALGACTSITLKMYAQRKQWPLQEVAVDLEYVRAGEQGTAANGPDLIRRRIALIGELDEAQRARLRQVAARCPVAKALQRGTAAIEDGPEA